jgi:hypothetical protein
VALLLIGAGAFFLMKGSDSDNKSGSGKDANQTSQDSSKASDAKQMSTLSLVAFAAPTDMSDYNAPQVTGAVKTYVTKSSSDTLYCAITFGIATAAQFPGADLNAIVKPQIDNVRSLGLTVEGPETGDPLVLKNTSSVKYSMPTLTYHVYKGDVHELDRYSLSILTSGDRAIVSRTCANKNGTVDESMMDKLDDTAKKLLISTK